MGFVVLASKMFKADVRVLLRRREAGVPEQFLNAPEVGTPFQQVRREAVPERMRRDPPAGRKMKAETLNQTLDVACVQPDSVVAHEQGPFLLRFIFSTST